MNNNLENLKIENIPSLSRSDLFKTELPFSLEIITGLIGSKYENPNNPTNIMIENLYTNGGNIYFSQEAINLYGENTVRIAYDYYKNFSKLKYSLEIKISVLSWIADNIFDIDRMNTELINKN